MARQSPVVGMSEEDRSLLLNYLCIRVNEHTMYMDCRTFEPGQEEYRAKTVREYTSALNDYEWASDSSLPITAAQLDRMVREVGSLPRICFHTQEAEFWAFYERMKHLIKVAREKAKAQLQEAA